MSKGSPRIKIILKEAGIIAANGYSKIGDKPEEMAGNEIDKFLDIFPQSGFQEPAMVKTIPTKNKIPPTIVASKSKLFIVLDEIIKPANIPNMPSIRNKTFLSGMFSHAFFRQKHYIE